MESNTEEEDKKEAIIKVEEETEDTTQVEDTHAPTLDEMIADPIAFRRYVSTLADATPAAPPDLYGDDFQNWQYHHLLTATLAHLLDTFKNHDDPKQHAWWYYDAFLKVNNTDYKESPFMAQASAKALFRHEAKGRRECAKVARAAAGLPVVKRERKSPGKQVKKERKRRSKRMLE